MAYLIIFFIVLALWHWIYESCIAPAWRMSIRNDLFALRDELRSLKIEKGNMISNEAFDMLNGSFNSLISDQVNIDVYSICKTAELIEGDPELKALVEARLKVLDESHCKEFQDIREQMNKAVLVMAVCNNGGWLIYLVPFAILCACKNALIRKTDEVIALTSEQIQRLLPRFA